MLLFLCVTSGCIFKHPGVKYPRIQIEEFDKVKQLEDANQFYLQMIDNF